MKHTKFKIIRSLIAPVILSGIISFNAGAQTGIDSSKKISSEVKVKEKDMGTAVLDYSVSNAQAAPFLIVIRDNQGAIVFREWAKGKSYQKRFSMNLDESESYHFEIIQNKKLVDTKTFTAKRRTEQFIEVLAINKK